MPKECFPFFGRPVSSTTQAEIGAREVILGKDALTNGLEKELVIPGRYGNNVMQGLVSAPDIVGVKTGGHGFHAFALSRQ